MVFVRKKKNKGGSISVQIIDKSSGQYEVYATIGSSSEPKQIEQMVNEAGLEILKLNGQQPLPFNQEQEEEFLKIFYDGIEGFSLVGPDLILGQLFDEIGFDKIEDELFKHLVITRLIYPVSKLRTVDYLFKFKGIVLDVVNVYRYLDKLREHQIELIQEISYLHTIEVLKQAPSIVFYDVTTLYFEAEQEDEFRKTGFSKDGKHQQPQIVLGLLVSKGGYPITYELFEGKKFEGHTILPVLESFKKKYELSEIIVVADSGLLSDKNIQVITEKNYQFILGARIKNEVEEVKNEIVKMGLKDHEFSELLKPNGYRLIISYSDSRAKKDAFNRQRGLAKLEKAVATGKLTKKHINNKGYNKYLKLEGPVHVSIDIEKFNADAKWDGLKGYVTNTNLSREMVIEQYMNLWEIEKTFRISKTDLRIRPIYHHVRRRIEAHICIAFAACKLYKELERQLKVKKTGISPEKAIDILKTIYEITIVSPYSYQKHTRLLLKNEEQKKLLSVFNLI